MQIRLGKTLWEINNRVAKSAEVDHLVMIAPSVIETHVFKYRMSWLGLRRRLIDEFDTYEEYVKDLDSEFGRWERKRIGSN
jgi:hypothetical protein